MGAYDHRPIVQRLSGKAIRLLKGVSHKIFPVQDRQHVFVAGMQRSGTNMVMEVLDRSFETDVYHESDGRAFDNYEMRSIDVVQRLADESGAKFFVIKSLCELDKVREFLSIFDSSRVLWMVRDYEDTIASAIRSFGNFPAQVGRIAVNRNSDAWRGRGMSDETHEILRQVYHPGMNEASAAALMWWFRNKLFFEQGLADEQRVCVIRYENLVRSPSRSFEEMFCFLGMKYAPWMSRHVFSNSIKRRESPPIEAPVRALCEDLMSNFNDLAPLFDDGAGR